MADHMIEVAKATVTIIPNMQGSQANITEQLTGQTTPAAKTAGDSAGKSFIDSFADAAKKGGDTLKGAGEAMSKYVTAPLVAGAAAAAAAWHETDEAYDTIIVKTGATGEALEEMRGTVDDIATSMPVSFQDAADAVGELNTRFGLTGDALSSASRAMLRYTKLTGDDVTGATDEIQKSMAAYGLTAKDLGSALDALMYVEQATGATTSELTSGLVNSAAVMQDLGLSYDDAAMFLGNLSKQGLESSAVMTGLRKAQTAAIKDGGSLTDYLADLESKLKDSTTATEATAEAVELFGAKSGAILANAIQGGTLSFKDLEDAAKGATGVLDQTFNATLDPADELASAMNEMKLLLADIGEVLIPVVVDVLKDLKPIIEDVSAAWQGLTPDKQEMIIKGLAGLAALGPALTAVGGALVTIGGAAGGLKALAGIGGAGAGAAAVGAGAGGAAAAGAGGAAAVGAGAGAKALLGNLAFVAAAVDVVDAAWRTFSVDSDASVLSAGEKWRYFGEELTGSHKEVLSLGSDLNNTKGYLNEFGTAGGNAIKSLGDTANETDEQVRGIRANLGGYHAEVEEELSGINKGVGETQVMVDGTAEEVSKTLTGLTGESKTWGTDMMKNYGEGVESASGSLIDKVKGIAQKVKDYLGFSEPKEGPLSDFHTYAPDMMNLFAEGIRDNTGIVTSAITDGMVLPMGDFSTDIDVQTAAPTGDIVIPVYIGQERMTEAVIAAQDLNTYLTGGR